MNRHFSNASEQIKICLFLISYLPHESKYFLFIFFRLESLEPLGCRSLVCCSEFWSWVLSLAFEPVSFLLSTEASFYCAHLLGLYSFLLGRSELTSSCCGSGGLLFRFALSRRSVNLTHPQTFRVAPFIEAVDSLLEGLKMPVNLDRGCHREVKVDY